MSFFLVTCSFFNFMLWVASVNFTIKNIWWWWWWCPVLFCDFVSGDVEGCWLCSDGDRGGHFHGARRGWPRNSWSWTTVRLSIELQHLRRLLHVWSSGKQQESVRRMLRQHRVVQRILQTDACLTPVMLSDAWILLSLVWFRVRNENVMNRPWMLCYSLLISNTADCCTVWISNQRHYWQLRDAPAVMKLITSKSSDCTSLLFTNLHRLKINERVKCNILSLACKVLTNTQTYIFP